MSKPQSPNLRSRCVYRVKRKLTAPEQDRRRPTHRQLSSIGRPNASKGREGTRPSSTPYRRHFLHISYRCSSRAEFAWGSLYHGTRTPCCCTGSGEQGLNKHKAEQTPKLSHLSHPVLSQLRICQRRSEHIPSRIFAFFSGFGFPPFRSALVRISSVCAFVLYFRHCNALSLLLVALSLRHV